MRLSVSRQYLSTIPVVLLGLFLAFLMSEYGTFLGLQVAAPLLAVLVFGWMYLPRGEMAVKTWMPSYTLLMLLMALCNLQAGIGFNFVVFTPIISYSLFLLFREYGVSLERFSVSILYILIVPLVVLELLVKLRLFDLTLISHFISQSGDMRLDVLRIKSPFGSPLSLASMCFAMIFYFFTFTKRRRELIALFVILIMTGSRTSLVASVLLVLYDFALRVLKEGPKSTINYKRMALVAPIGIGLVVVALYYLNSIGMGAIIERALSLQSYDIGRDASFQGRSDTTVSTIVAVLDNLPRSLLLGQQEHLISDSSIVTIASQSGLITAFLFMLIFFSSTAQMALSGPYKIGFMLLFTLLLLMVGDAVVPLVSLFYFLIFYTHSHNVGRALGSPAQIAGPRTLPLFHTGAASPDEVTGPNSSGGF